MATKNEKYVVGTIRQATGDKTFSFDLLKGKVYTPQIKGESDKAKTETALGNIRVASKAEATILNVAGLTEIPPAISITVCNYCRALANVVLGLTTVTLPDAVTQVRLLETRNSWLPELVEASRIAMSGGKTVSSGSRAGWHIDARVFLNLVNSLTLDTSAETSGIKDVPADF